MEGRRTRRHSAALHLDPASLLRAMEQDPSTLEGARNAVRTCLGVEQGQLVVLVVESGQESLAAPFLTEAEALGARVEAHIVDERKAAHEPTVGALCAQLAGAHASLFVGTVDGLPRAFRQRLVRAGGARRRHAHMPGLSLAMMQQSMRTDYADVQRLTAALAARLAGATLTVRSARGTDLVLRCGARWHQESGVLRAPGWTNLPAGEVLASPRAVEGWLVPDGGAWDARGQPIAKADRLRVRFDGGSVTRIEGGPGADPEGLLGLLDAHANARRVGQIGLGTNLGVVVSVGDLLQDLKMPGFHLTLGHAAPEHTGAGFACEVEVPLIVRRADVDADGTPILRHGRYVAPWA